MNIEFKIRKDFQSIEEETFKLNEYGKIFHNIRDEYTRFRNQEDFQRIYSLEEELQRTFDRLYSSGANCSFNIYHILENINYFDFYPTLTDLINELDEKFSCITNLETILFNSKEACTQLEFSLYSIEEMNRLHEKQISYLSNIKDIITTIKESKLYKNENNILDLNKDKFDYQKLRNDLIEISLLETKNRNAISEESEDKTNDRFRNALSNRNHNVTYQSRGGESSSGINAGERDLVICNSQGIDESVIEAFILNSLDSTVINKHYEKLVKCYDTVGNEVNFILVYSKTKNFDNLWAKYVEYDGFDNFEDTEDKYSKKKNIRVGISKYGEMMIYHLFINFYSHRED